MLCMLLLEGVELKFFAFNCTHSGVFVYLVDKDTKLKALRTRIAVCVDCYWSINKYIQNGRTRKVELG